ncbi:MAG TPA: flagellar biosynthesis protein FlhB [Stellaceae bacterium]|nr:flagellar biosynthesis protein FlhB [Stellaceae bacterium]
MAEGSDNRTEQPTQRKLNQARLRGQVVQSREINSLFMLSAGAVIVLLLAPPLARRLDTTLARFLDPARLSDGGGILWEAVANLLAEVAGVMVLPLILLIATAIAGSLLQTGFVLAFEKVGFDLSRLSLLSGFSRLFSLRSALEFIKNLAKVAVIMAIAVWMLLPEVARLPLLASLGAGALATEIHHLLLRLTLAVLLLVAVLAVLDYGYQRFAFLRSMRMSRQEIKEEHKQAEGDPMVKARLRQIRMERTRRRMMAAVPTASVVVTNPTHYAVALAYEMGDKGAPKVVAKGADLIALRIREVAEENDVPVVENPPLARALYAHVELDQEIPQEHYRAVAEIISYVFRLRGKMQPR